MKNQCQVRYWFFSHYLPYSNATANYKKAVTAYIVYNPTINT